MCSGNLPGPAIVLRAHRRTGFGHIQRLSMLRVMLVHKSGQILLKVSGGIFEGAGVVDDVVGCGLLLIERKLAGFAGGQHGRVPAAFGDPLLSQFFRDVDKHDGIADVVPPCFEQHGGIQQNHVGLIRVPQCLDGSRELLPDQGVNDGFQVVAVLSVVRLGSENLPAQGGPLNFSRIVEDIVSETSPDLLFGGGISQYFVPETINVDGGDPERSGTRDGLHETACQCALT